MAGDSRDRLLSLCRALLEDQRSLQRGTGALLLLWWVSRTGGGGSTGRGPGKSPELWDVAPALGMPILTPCATESFWSMTAAT